MICEQLTLFHYNYARPITNPGGLLFIKHSQGYHLLGSQQVVNLLTYIHAN
jgi:hypothetical protein